MKTSDLKVGTVYAFGSPNSNYIKSVGMLLGTDMCVGPGQYSRSDAISIALARPSKFERRAYGLPVAIVQRWSSAAEKLAEIDPTKIKLKLDQQTVDGIQVTVKLVLPGAFRCPYSDWVRAEQAREARVKADVLSEDRRRTHLESVAARLIERCAELGLGKPSIDTYYSTGKVIFYRAEELLAALAELERKAVDPAV